MHVSLTPALRKFVEDEVRTGAYLSSDDVIREGLRRLKREKLPRQPRNREELVALLSKRAAAAERGETENGASVFRTLRRKA
jgi:putative addiction module CopG family antidote